jgi:hypothetical protein
VKVGDPDGHVLRFDQAEEPGDDPDAGTDPVEGIKRSFSRVARGASIISASGKLR